MEGMSFGAIASIGLVAIIALSILVKTVKQRGTDAKAPPRPDMVSDQNVDAAAKVLSAISAHTQSDVSNTSRITAKSNWRMCQSMPLPISLRLHFLLHHARNGWRVSWKRSFLAGKIPNW